MSMNENNKRLCLDLMKADSEEEVVALLKKAGYWDDKDAWRYYGDRETNYNVIGNQSSKPDVALVEKLVNSVDARLILECLLKGIDPEGPDAPTSIRSAVAEFFEGGSKSSTAGLVREWQPGKRTRVSRGITLAATGHPPRAGNPSFTIADSGEGQTPEMMPYTLLSLDRGNKIRINFVQGKYNMGGSGVLEFCGKQNLQLVLSRRAPKLIDKKAAGTTDRLWGFTIVRRENPTGGRRNSVFTYLAPVGSGADPRQGNVLTFDAKSMPIFPEANEAYKRHSDHGTLIKLYEYSTEGFSSSHILRKGGLLQKLDLRLARVALPIRLHECRLGYRGGKASFDTTISGLEVRLDDDRAKNLEEVYSFGMDIDDQPIKGMIYVFKKGQDSAYRGSEGVIFTHNGQTHGHLTKTFFRRGSVNMGYLKNSILVILNCDQIKPRPRERLFMPSRDRLRDIDLKAKIEEDLGSTLMNHAGLRELRNRRRAEEIGELLEDSKPLEDILQLLIEQSPAIASLLTPGMRLSVPFKSKDVGKSDEKFKGKRYPSFFKFKDVEYGEKLRRNCHINVRARVTFETDAVNDYFSRSVDTGEFEIHQVIDDDEIRLTNRTINLVNGIATLNLTLPDDIEPGDDLEFVTRTTDASRVSPFENTFVLHILEPAKKKKPKKRTRRKPPSDDEGEDRETSKGSGLPKVIKVYEESDGDQKGWDDMDPPFDEYSALRIESNGIDNTADSASHVSYDFYVNMDNIYLKHELKGKVLESELTQTRFANGLVLVGIALLNYDKDEHMNLDASQQEESEDDERPIEDRIEETSRAIGAVLLPMIEGLSKLTEEDIEEADFDDEDAQDD